MNAKKRLTAALAIYLLLVILTANRNTPSTPNDNGTDSRATACMCLSNADCKFPRVCQNGSCVNPPAPDDAQR